MSNQTLLQKLSCSYKQSLDNFDHYFNNNKGCSNSFTRHFEKYELLVLHNLIPYGFLSVIIYFMLHNLEKFINHGPCSFKYAFSGNIENRKLFEFTPQTLYTPSQFPKELFPNKIFYHDNTQFIKISYGYDRNTILQELVSMRVFNPINDKLIEVFINGRSSFVHLVKQLHDDVEPQNAEPQNIVQNNVKLQDEVEYQNVDDVELQNEVELKNNYFTTLPVIIDKLSNDKIPIDMTVMFNNYPNDLIKINSSNFTIKNFINLGVSIQIHDEKPADLKYSVDDDIPFQIYQPDKGIYKVFIWMFASSVLMIIIPFFISSRNLHKKREASTLINTCLKTFLAFMVGVGLYVLINEDGKIKFDLKSSISNMHAVHHVVTIVMIMLTIVGIISFLQNIQNTKNFELTVLSKSIFIFMCCVISMFMLLNLGSQITSYLYESMDATNLITIALLLYLSEYIGTNSKAYWESKMRMKVLHLNMLEAQKSVLNSNNNNPEVENEYQTSYNKVVENIKHPKNNKNSVWGSSGYIGFYIVTSVLMMLYNLVRPVKITLATLLSLYYLKNIFTNTTNEKYTHQYGYFVIIVYLLRICIDIILSSSHSIKNMHVLLPFSRIFAPKTPYLQMSQNQHMYSNLFFAGLILMNVFSETYTESKMILNEIGNSWITLHNTLQNHKTKIKEKKIKENGETSQSFNAKIQFNKEYNNLLALKTNFLDKKRDQLWSFTLFISAILSITGTSIMVDKFRNIVKDNSTIKQSRILTIYLTLLPLILIASNSYVAKPIFYIALICLFVFPVVVSLSKPDITSLLTTFYGIGSTGFLFMLAKNLSKPCCDVIVENKNLSNLHISTIKYYLGFILFFCSACIHVATNDGTSFWEYSVLKYTQNDMEKCKTNASLNLMMLLFLMLVIPILSNSITWMHNKK